MAEYTTNYRLEKPLGTEFYNVLVFNGNMDILDEKLKATADEVAGQMVKPKEYTPGNIMEFDENGNPRDSGERIGEKAQRPEAVPVILSVSEWSNRAYILANENIRAGSNGDVKIAIHATDAEFDAFQEANMRVIHQEEGKITLKSGGVTPAIDVPVELEVRS